MLNSSDSKGTTHAICTEPIRLRASPCPLQDGKEVKHSERIAAQQQLVELESALRKDVEAMGIDPDKAAEVGRGERAAARDGGCVRGDALVPRHVYV